MLRLMFLPFRFAGGLIAGVLATRLFERIWRVIDKEKAPDPGQREISIGKLATALLVQGAVFRAVRGLVDHGSREAFRRLTGRWPGEERAAPEDS